MNLKEQCEVLLSVCAECRERHLQMRAENREPDFFTEVKPYADQYHTLLDEWTEAAYVWIQAEKPKYTHPAQVENLQDAMKQFIVQSFYPKTGLKRFAQSIQSAEYTLKTFLEGLEKEGK